MYESLLPKRLRSAYRCSRWRKRLDDRARALFGWGYLSRTVGYHLREWIDFLRGYEDRAELPTDIQDPEVVEYLSRRCADLWEGRRHVRASLRLLLHPKVERPRRHPCARKTTTALQEAYVPKYLTFARDHRGCRRPDIIEGRLQGFFGWLDAQGVNDIEAVSSALIRDYFASLTHLARSTVTGQVSALRGFLRYLGMQGTVPTVLARIVESPRQYRMSQPPQVLDDETVERMLGAVNRSTAIGKRDYAVLLLAARYGMRPSDIRGLELPNIDWRGQRIVFVQSKSQRPLELPLLADVDTALIDYLRHGRPACSAGEVFVRHHRPIGPLAASVNFWDAMQHAFKAAGIEPPNGQRGLYLLRHSTATRMLRQGVSFDTISDVLGHASVESTRIYAQVDIAGLRSVALSTGEVRT